MQAVSLENILPADGGPHPNGELSESEFAAVTGDMTYTSFACPLPETLVGPLGPC